MTTIEKIKQSFPIQILAAKACGGLKSSSKNGRYFIGWCPFCQQARDKKTRPKFWVDTELQLCNCFKPTCRESKPMDVINFYARLNGLDNDSAIVSLWYERQVS